MKAFTASRIFTGTKWLNDHAIVIDENIIHDVVPADEVDFEVISHPNAIIIPAFIDLQIYGAYGRLLSVYPDPDSLYQLNEYCRSGGATYCLPTLATNTYDVFKKAIDAIRKYWKDGGKGILGLHLEGPWINKKKRGAHIEEMIHAPNIEQVSDILDYGKNVIKMITLAPEICSKEVFDLIIKHGVVISAGHSDATYNEALQGYDYGITTTTHLFNAMSPLQHRAPGLAGAVLNHNKVYSSIIPDGHHVDFAAVSIAKKIMNDRLFVITDAVTETNEGPYQHYKVGDKYESNGILSGSALTMNKAVKNLVAHCNVEMDDAIRMCSVYPAKVIGLGNKLGKIEKGYRANMAVLNKSMDVMNVYGGDPI